MLPRSSPILASDLMTTNSSVHAIHCCSHIGNFQSELSSWKLTMGYSWLSQGEIQSLRANFTSSGNHDHQQFLRCWKHQTCDSCLAISQCSWCPFVRFHCFLQEPMSDVRNLMNEQTWSCVPNINKIPLLAPAYDEHICPHEAERWELRSRPLGCHVSTITSLTAIVTIASTLTFVLLIILLILAIRWFRRYRKNHGWWWLQNHRWGRTWLQCGEREPLLPESRPGNGSP